MSSYLPQVWVTCVRKEEATMSVYSSPNFNSLSFCFELFFFFHSAIASSPEFPKQSCSK